MQAKIKWRRGHSNRAGGYNDQVWFASHEGKRASIVRHPGGPAMGNIYAGDAPLPYYHAEMFCSIKECKLILGEHLLGLRQ